MEHTMKCEHPNCNVSEGEMETAKRLNMDPEEFHYMMDVHVEVIAEIAKNRPKRYAETE